MLHLFNKHQRFAHHLSLLQALLPFYRVWNTVMPWCSIFTLIHSVFLVTLSQSPWRSDCFYPWDSCRSYFLCRTHFFMSDRLLLSCLWGCFRWHNWCLPPGFSVIMKTSTQRVDYCATGDFSFHWKQQHDNHIYKMWPWQHVTTCHNKYTNLDWEARMSACLL